MRTILFICTGNTCRSPMAEAIGRQWADSQPDGDGSIFVASAGVFASEGAPISPETLLALESRGIPHTGASKRLTGEMIANATLVLCMGRHHAEAARALVTDADDIAKIALLDPDSDIPDPIGMGQAAYESLADEMMERIPRRLKEMIADEQEPDHRPRSGSSRD